MENDFAPRDRGVEATGLEQVRPEKFDCTRSALCNFGEVRQLHRVGWIADGGMHAHARTDQPLDERPRDVTGRPGDHDAGAACKLVQFRHDVFPLGSMVCALADDPIDGHDKGPVAARCASLAPRDCRSFARMTVIKRRLHKARQTSPISIAGA